MIENFTSAEWGAEKADEVRGLRQQAMQLLARLKTSRAMSERRAAENGLRDPMKFITGRSALDSAIAATQGMIDRLEALLAELDPEFAVGGGNGSLSRAAALAEVGSGR